MRQDRYRAVSLTEYAFPLALVAVACIVATTLLGASARDVLGWMANSMKSEPIMVSQGNLTEASPAATPSAAIEEKTAAPTVDIQALKKATEDYLPSFSETKKILDTTGANGATVELLSRLETLIPIWQAQNAITPADADMLKQLAQSGYQLAANQAALESAFGANGKTVTLGGATYTLQQAAELHGFKNTTDSIASSQGQVTSLNASEASAMLKPLLEQYQKASASSAMSNPIVSQEVTAMVRQMAAVDDSLSWAAHSLSTDEANLVTGKNRTSVLNSSVVINFTNLSGTTINGPASVVSAASSDQICQSSNAKKCR